MKALGERMRIGDPSAPSFASLNEIFAERFNGATCSAAFCAACSLPAGPLSGAYLIAMNHLVSP